MAVLWYIGRYGKSTTLVGDVEHEKVHKEDELLSKVIGNYLTPSLSNRGRTIIQRISLLGKGKKGKTTVFGSNLKSFQKLRSDNDLYLEALSFLHVSEFILLQSVCKKWYRILSYGLRTMANVVVTSRDFYYNRVLIEKLLLEERLFAQSLANSQLSMPTSTVTLRPIYVDPATLLSIMKISYNHIVSLKLHYVVLNNDTISYMSHLAGKLKSLSLGIVKIDHSANENDGKLDLGKDEEEEEEKDSSSRAGKYSRPSTSEKKRALPRQPSKKGLKLGSTSSKSLFPGEEQVKSTANTPTSASIKDNKPRQKLPPSKLPFINGADVDKILSICGANLNHLELSIMVGQLTTDTFRKVPKLKSLQISGVHYVVKQSEILKETKFNFKAAGNDNENQNIFVDCIANVDEGIEGGVNPRDFSQVFRGISVPNLLVYMIDTSTEAYLLLDKRGKIIAGNFAWEKLVGVSSKDVFGLNLSFLEGPLTDTQEMQQLSKYYDKSVKSVLKNNYRRSIYDSDDELDKQEESEYNTNTDEYKEVITYLYNANEKPFLAQIIFLPRACKYKGEKLSYNALNYDNYSKLALMQEEIEEAKDEQNLLANPEKYKKLMRWLGIQKEHEYHLLRFGPLSAPF